MRPCSSRISLCILIQLIFSYFSRICVTAGNSDGRDDENGDDKDVMMMAVLVTNKVRDSKLANSTAFEIYCNVTPL